MVVAQPLIRRSRVCQGGALTFELVAAMAIVLVAVLPLGFSFLNEQRLCRIYYLRAIATEIVDGEMEVLAAGEWRNTPLGTHTYQVKIESAQNLPSGRFLLIRDPERLSLEWVPDKKSHGGRVFREVRLP